MPEIREGEDLPNLGAVLDEVCQHVETVSGEVPSPATKATLAKLIRKAIDAGVSEPQQLKDDAIAALPHCIPAHGR